MHWTDTSIVLSARKHGENSIVARLFAREHGVYGGVIRAAHSKTNRGIIQPGNLVTATWNARLSEQLGTFKTELLEANTAHIMHDSARLTALTSACALIESALPERHPYTKLYKSLHIFIVTLLHSDHWPEAYVQLELDILAEAGFGLDLTSCAATDTTDDLIYVSPKSGRAVCRNAGAPYREKMLPLPAFLLPKKPPSLTLPPPGRGNIVSPLPQSGGGLGRGASLTEKARELRKNLTDMERILWHELRAHRFERYGFRRQYPVSDRYIADFICLDKKLILELDGGRHAEQQEYDAKRTAFLEQEGYKVLRFWNNDVSENIEGVLTTILGALEQPPSLALPRAAGEGIFSPLSPEGGGLGRGSSLPPTAQKTSPNTAEILDGLQLTGYFLDHWLLEPHHRKVPAARSRLVGILKENALKELHGPEETAA
jgi:DNA repair protein RecO (recombination protein O)